MHHRCWGGICRRRRGHGPTVGWARWRRRLIHRRSGGDVGRRGRSDRGRGDIGRTRRRCRLIHRRSRGDVGRRGWRHGGRGDIGRTRCRGRLVDRRPRRYIRRLPRGDVGSRGRRDYVRSSRVRPVPAIIRIPDVARCDVDVSRAGGGAIAAAPIPATVPVPATWHPARAVAAAEYGFIPGGRGGHADRYRRGRSVWNLDDAGLIHRRGLDVRFGVAARQAGNAHKGGAQTSHGHSLL